MSDGLDQACQASRNVAIFDPLSKHGGMHYYVHDHAEALGALGLTVSVYSPITGLPPSAHHAHHIAFDGVYGRAHKLVRAYRLLAGNIRATTHARKSGTNVAIFHVFKSDGFEAAAVAFARLIGLQTFVIVHDVARLDAKAKFSLLAGIARRTTGVIVHNEFSRSALMDTANVDAAKVCVIPHGNYITQFLNPPSVAQARASLDLPPNKMTLLFFGNPRREKGLHILLDALVPLAGRDDLLLVVAGKMKGPEEEEVRQFVKANNLESIVRLDIGHVADERVADYYRAASVVVLPYLRVYESGVALMAMSLGRPILASDLPVFDHIISESGAGLLFSAGDSQDLSRVIGQLADDQVDIGVLGEKAFNFAASKRSWAQSGHLFKRFIEGFDL
jgi:D-inositol-3-phosphate glycosyltransferase